MFPCKYNMKAVSTKVPNCTYTRHCIGLPFSYGVFQQYYSTHEPFASKPRNIAAVGTITTGFMYFLQPFVALASQRWQQSRRPIAMVGHSLLLIGLISASFANRIGELMITQGILYAFGSTHLHLSPIPATLLISVLNLSSVAGTILHGYLIDHLAPSSVILTSSLGAALSVFLVWGFAISKPIIYVFAIAYGIFAGGYSATWTGYVSEIQREAREADAGIVIAVLGAGRGLGSVSSGLISEALLEYGGWEHLRGAYGTEYGVLIVFTGVTAVVGGVGFLTRFRFRGVGGESVASTMEIRTSHEETR
ncbi:MAG: hypothetical protein Q9223_006348 [Gallowayella weberi]